MGKQRKRQVDVEVAITPKYTKDNGVRMVAPYFHSFSTFAKGRWLGRELKEILCKEFGSHDVEYWDDAIKDGFVTINGSIVSSDYIIKNSDKLVHRTHRHEPPIVGEIAFVGMTADIVAINKPSSMPMHPCGAYRFNSLSMILYHEPIDMSAGKGSSDSTDNAMTVPPALHIVHRLDRVTSGLVILATSSKAARELGQQISSRQTKKTYLARVKGKFAIPDMQSAVTSSALSHLKQVPDLLRQFEDFVAFGGCDDDEAGGGGYNNTSDNYGGGNGTGKRKYEDPGAKYAVKHTASGHKSDGSANEVSGNAESNKRSPVWGYEWLPPNNSIFPVAPNPALYNSKHSSSNEDTHTLVVAMPISVVSYKDGVYKCDDGSTTVTNTMVNYNDDKDGDVAGAPVICPPSKPSYSAFRCISYDEQTDTSLIECRLLTGRTHQLRLHLQLVGTSIANDPCYGGELFYASADTSQVARAQQAYKTLVSLRCGKVSNVKIKHLETLFGEGGTGTTRDITSTDSSASTEVADSSASTEVAAVPPVPSALDADLTSDEAKIVRLCRYCQEEHTGIAQLERHVHCDGIFLHALRYEGADWSFETAPPAWA